MVGIASTTDISHLLDRYEGFLVDAYGVLNDAGGALPGAAAFVAELARRGKPWVLLTNDASRTPATIAARLTRFGVPVREEQVVSSGLLLAQAGLAGKRTICLGTPDSHAMTRAAGAVLVEPRGATPDAIVVADDSGYEFLDAIEATIAAALRTLDAGRPLDLLLPNPDLLYPKPGGEMGLTSGAVALLVEAALDRLRPGAPRFTRLGKPHRPLFDLARQRLATGPLVMIGDQLETDIAGALGAGLDAALVASGVDAWRPGVEPVPTWLIPSIAP